MRWPRMRVFLVVAVVSTASSAWAIQPQAPAPNVAPTFEAPGWPLTISLQLDRNTVLGAHRAIRFEVIPTVPLTDALEIELRLNQRSAVQGLRDLDLDAAYTLSVPRGTEGLNGWLYVPSAGTRYHSAIYPEVRINGQPVAIPINALNIYQTGAPPGYMRGLCHLVTRDDGESHLEFGVAQGGPPGLHVPLQHGTFKASTSDTYSTGIRGAAVSVPLYGTSSLVLDMGNLHEHWQGYLQYQSMFASVETIDRIRKERPRHWDALRKWIFVGGNLAVYGPRAHGYLSENFPNQQEIEIPGSLQADSVADWSKGYIIKQDLVEWQQGVNITSPGSTADESPENAPVHRYFYSWYEQAKAALEQNASKEADRAFLDSIQHARFGTGNVMAIQTERIEDLTWQHWSWILSVSEQHPLSMYLSEQSTRYYGSLNDRLSVIPVRMFWVFITGFIFAIGPLLYILLRKKRELYRVYLWVPPFSAVVAIAAIGIARINEGFHPRAAITRLTYVDSGMGRMDVSQETILNPTRGPSAFSIPSEAFSFPLRAQNVYSDWDYDFFDTYQTHSPPSSHSGPAKTSLRVDGDNQTWSFAPGVLRDQTPFLVVNPRFDEWTVTEVAGKPGTLRNGMPLDLKEIIYCDGKSNYWHADRIPEGETVQLESLQRIDAFKSIKKIAERLPQIRDEGLAFVEDRFLGVRIYRVQSLSMQGLRGRQMRMSDINLPAEQMLNSWQQGKMPPRSFVSRADDHVRDGMVPDAQVIQSEQVILGTTK